MQTKIEKGEYVDLERLLPNNKFRKPLNPSGSVPLQWRFKDGETFLAPAEKERKINNVRRWDQAFRTYATIYCKANRDRAGEIWQYIDCIHTAANVYVWDNVANYDYVFRQLMQFNPKRSWAITYNHMWNLTMTEPIPKNYNQFSSFGNRETKGKKKEETNAAEYDHCWSFNRGHCKYGNKCRYDNRCSYCDSPKHGKINCPRLDKGKESTSKDSNANKSYNGKKK